MATSAQIRQQLVEALQLDLIGPGWDDVARRHERLPQPPSIWYTTGFLVPNTFQEEAGRPLIHNLIHFADLRNFYRDMREALITANRRAGAQQALVTKAKKKIAQLEAEMARLEHERDDLLAYRQRVEEEANQISAVLPRLKGRLLQVQQIEQAHGCTSRGQPQRAAAMAGVALPGSTAGGGRSCLGGAR